MHLNGVESALSKAGFDFLHRPGLRRPVRTALGIPTRNRIRLIFPNAPVLRNFVEDGGSGAPRHSVTKKASAASDGGRKGWLATPEGIRTRDIQVPNTMV
jgi:hypothetical protein